MEERASNLTCFENGASFDESQITKLVGAISLYVFDRLKLSKDFKKFWWMNIMNSISV